MNSTRLGIIANQFYFDTEQCFIFECAASEIFLIVNIVLSLIK